MATLPKRKSTKRKSTKRKSTQRGKSAAQQRKRKTSREKVQAHRRRLRAQGLRPIQIWVPDTRSRRFALEASRQSQRVAASRHATDNQAFIAALGELDFE